jgi:hypothetical protein
MNYNNGRSRVVLTRDCRHYNYCLDYKTTLRSANDMGQTVSGNSHRDARLGSSSRMDLGRSFL